ncbi:hypothetical protein [Brevundimonas sp.]|uniref:hypothetical protein n=1 Tax=Brevundimonas sp. TaxID=1871086 RepID=UPI003BAD9A79
MTRVEKKGTSKPKPKRQRKASATTRSTGGPGYQFEDLVAARLLIQMLLDRSLQGIGAGAERLQFQADALGWRIDDLLVTVGDGPSESRLALSCKSSLQVSGNGFPNDFITRAWELWDGADAGPMNRSSDFLGLVTRGRHNVFDPLWADIVQWCNESPNAVALARIRKSAKHQKIFESVKRPSGGVEASDEETVALLRRLLVMPLDFQLEPSRDWDDSIELSRTLAASGNLDDAREIWKEVVGLAASKRVVGGAITVDELWSKLRAKFALTHRPDYAASWKMLEAVTDEYRAGIATTLQSGHSVSRTAERDQLARLVEGQTFTLVYGDSGSGKSALVKLLLDERSDRQVWLGPEQVAVMTSEVHRSKLGLAFPLSEVLATSTSAPSVLVIDAAEKLTVASLTSLKAMLERLVPLAADPLSWKVIIITQAESWIDRAAALLGQRTVTPFEVIPISADEVRKALLSTSNLHWLANDAQSVEALRNLKMLSWAVQAEGTLHLAQADVTSPSALADRIWGHWTAGRPDVQRLLMKLAQREANFERSFPIADLESGDATALSNAPDVLPLRPTNRNRLVFEHDMAADWSRFQWLKQVAEDTTQWAPLAVNPLWAAALRMLGHFLLREPSGAASAWDVALEDLEKSGDRAASSILLDALCLDPDAHRLLTERAQTLLANGGAMLDRLLKRFLHIATAPRFPSGALTIEPGLALYIEANIRQPIIGRWPAMAVFLYAHRERLAELASPTVSKICEFWLTTMPPALADGSATPFRREFAEIALANARTVQVHKGSGVLYLGDDWEPLYSAALSAARDLPEEIGAWIMEMVRRRPLADDVRERVSQAKERKEQERAQQPKTAQAKRPSPPISFRNSRDLPAWPLGPDGRIDHQFHKVAVVPAALVPLMHVRPKLAAEALLALLIEGRPVEEFSRNALHEKLGLEYESTSYPTAFWKSPFFQFLQIEPDTALSTLLQLVDFCTDRWVAGRASAGEHAPPSVSVPLPDGPKAFLGNCAVFDWTQDDDHGYGQLNCALNALERWLTLQLEVGVDIDDYISRILAESKSVAFLGLLTNIAKFQPALLRGVLRPLLASEPLYWFDNWRLGIGNRFVAWAWTREGDAVFEIAKDWALAPYRQQRLIDLSVALVKSSSESAIYVKGAIAEWQRPDEPDEAIDFDSLCAALDPANYRKIPDEENGSDRDEFVLPTRLAEDITRRNSEDAEARREANLPMQLSNVLRSAALLDAESSAFLAGMLDDNSTDKPNPNLVAIASTLVARAGDWLLDHPDAETQAHSVLLQATIEVADDHDKIRNDRIRSSRGDMDFAAFGVAHLWIHNGDDGRWDEPLLRLLTSGHSAAVRVIAVDVTPVSHPAITRVLW